MARPSLTRLLLCAILAAGSAAAAPAAPDPSVVTGPPEAQPPPGSREDQALWRSGLETQTGALIEQERTRRLMFRLREERQQERLEARARSAPHEAAEEAAEAAKRLAAATDEAYRLGSKPPFDLRTGCRYEIIRLGQAMQAPAGSKHASDLATARTELAACRDTVQRWLVPAAAANDRLEAAMARAEKLAPAVAAAAPAPAQQAETPPAKASGKN